MQNHFLHLILPSFVNRTLVRLTASVYPYVEKLEVVYGHKLVKYPGRSPEQILELLVQS